MIIREPEQRSKPSVAVLASSREAMILADCKTFREKTMLWLKAFHIIAVICWFAGLFYLPRLFVYHVATRDDAGHERFVIMARKLYRGIMWPSMIATIALGIALLILQWPAWQGQGWLHAKLALVVTLVGYHLACGHYRQQLAERRCQKSPVFFRVFNEAPVLALIAIVILVTVKPF